MFVIPSFLSQYNGRCIMFKSHYLMFQGNLYLVIVSEQLFLEKKCITFSEYIQLLLGSKYLLFNISVKFGKKSTLHFSIGSKPNFHTRVLTCFFMGRMWKIFTAEWCRKKSFFTKYAIKYGYLHSNLASNYYLWILMLNRNRFLYAST